MDWIQLALRFTHVVFGVFWAGTIFFVVSFLLPAVRKAGPDGGKVMYQLIQGPFPSALPSAAALTILSGLAMFFYPANRMASGFMGETQGIVLSTGALLAIIAFAIGMTIQRPSSLAVAALQGEIQAAGGAPTAAQSERMAALQARVALSLRWISILLGLAVAAMGTWRYF
jgi:hypothetical protein